ncbi:hypothetical protein EJ08DRAFT_467429 [Tothia fuscella]|uniref:Uncharacterized protein n=1 Tax=Tothia fuscella TaxID=1048955 RepID=A0A9P4NXY3_9PEZI|nr:hypothetical protein EJ08DRAFT_467429 [Tothia fuscella]
MATDHRHPAAAHHSKKSQLSNARRPVVSKRHSGYAVPKVGKKSVRVHEDEGEEDIMAATFPQYCATCEKQIIVPCNAVLYCSEGCRRKDSVKSIDLSQADYSPPLTPLQTFTFDDFPARDIIPRRSPTIAQNPNRLSYSSISEDDTHSEDERRPPLNRQDSEAQRYLRQFGIPEAQRGFVQAPPSTPRPRYNRSSTALSTMSQAPSLSHSPTSTTGMSFPYTPSTTSRPLPPRTNPFSTSYKYARSIDLVNPFAQAMPQTAPSSLHQQTRDRRVSLKSGAGAQTSTGFAEGEILYEKMMTTHSSPSAGNGSLRQLFHYNEPTAMSSTARY